ncbi:MAG: TIGR00341 family protein [Actinobacteria bacterium]|nr:TIGR00341 family protein [Actinomycetota bacterium]
MGWLTRAIDAGGEYRNPLNDIEDGLFLTTGARRAKTSQFWVLLVLASMIAAGGVVGDSTPAVIGAMIVAPLATPIYGVALATVTGSRRDLLASLLLLVEGVAVNILVGVLIGAFTVSRMPVYINPQIIGRTAPTLLDLGVATTVGVAGSFALVRRDVSNILAGVAIAISLVPVLAVVGITLGSGRLDLAWGAFILFLTNAAAIIVAGVVVFTAAGYEQVARERGRHPRRRAKILIAVFVIALLIPLSLASLRTLRYEQWTNAAGDAAAQWVKGTDWKVEYVKQEGGDIVITAIGPGDPPPIEGLRRAVRRNVPSPIGVRVVEDSGNTTEL